jgi:hypothetical protein
MAKDAATRSPVWAKFERAARERRQNPVRLLTAYMAECLERWGDQRLDMEMQRDARRSGHRERDAVAIVDQHRREKRARSAAS